MFTFRPIISMSIVQLVHRTYVTTSVLHADLPQRSILFTESHKHSERAAAPIRINGSPQFENLPQFEKDVLANPYAKMLASPIRKCIYSEKNLPNAFLTRLVVARDKSTNHHRIVSTVARENIKGSGWWVKASAAYLEAFHNERKHKRISSTALFRPDIHSHIRSLLQSQTFTIIQTVFEAIARNADEHNVGYPLFIPLRRQGEILEPADTNTVGGFQCAIEIPVIMNSQAEITTNAEYKWASKFPIYERVLYKKCSNSESITARIPVYDVREFWEDETIRQVKSMFGIGECGANSGLADNWQIGNSGNIIVGIVSDVRTVKLAISLWQMKYYG